MNTVRRFDTSCWNEPASLVALSRNPARYQEAAQAVLDAVPESWTGIRVWMALDDRNRETCGAEATCGSQDMADDACLDAVRDAMVLLARDALIPQRLSWVRVSLTFDLEDDRLVACLSNGGRMRRSRDIEMLDRTMTAITAMTAPS